MQTGAIWLPETDDLFSAVVARGRDRRYLVVERLPDGDWDWVTWSHEPTAVPVHGRSSDRLAAMHAAEAATVECLASCARLYYLRNVPLQAWACAMPFMGSSTSISSESTGSGIGWSV